MLWAVCVAVIAIWLAVSSRQLKLETSVLAMLPPSERDPALHELSSQLSGRAARSLVILVGHTEREQALAAVALAEKELRDSGEFSALNGAFDAESERAFFDLYFPHRYELLSRDLRAQLEAGAGAEELTLRVLKLLQSPASSLYTGLLERDPLLLHPATLQGWTELKLGVASSEGYLLLEHEGTT